MARFRLIPREETFYVDFVAMADQVRMGARLLEEMLAVDPPHADKAQARRATGITKANRIR